MTGYSLSKWLPPSIIRVTACTGRTLGFLSRMVSKRYLPGYRRWLGLLKGEAETCNLWVSACSLVSAGIRRQRGRLGYRFILGCRKRVTQARRGWVSSQFWLASRVNAPAFRVWVSTLRWLVQVCLRGFYVFFCDVAFVACDVVEGDAVFEVQCFRDLVDFIGRP